MGRGEEGRGGGGGFGEGGRLGLPLDLDWGCLGGRLLDGRGLGLLLDGRLVEEQVVSLSDVLLRGRGLRKDSLPCCEVH